MDFESKKLKSAAELAIEKAEEIEGKAEKKPDDVENNTEIDHQKAETAAMEIKSSEADIEKIKVIGEKLGVDVSASIEEKQDKINDLEKKFDKSPENKENFSNKNEDDMDLKNLAVAKELLNNIKRMKRGEAPAEINLEGLSEDDKKDLSEVQKMQGVLHEIKKSKTGENAAENKNEKKEESKEIKCRVCGAKTDGNFCDMCAFPLRDKEGKEIIYKSIIVPQDKDQVQIIGEKNQLRKMLAGKVSPEELGGMSYWDMKAHAEKMAPVEKAKEAGEENKVDEKIEEKAKNDEEKSVIEDGTEKQKENPAEKMRKNLMDKLDSIEGVQGSQRFYSSSELKKTINEVVDSGDFRQLTRITNQGELKLRDRAHAIMKAEEKI